MREDVEKKSGPFSPYYSCFTARKGRLDSFFAFYPECALALGSGVYRTVALQNYQELEVWQKSMDLAVSCYEATRSFPKEELFGLTSQIRRESSSMPANVAEGQGRQSTKEFLNFLSIARGSLKEVETHLILSQRIGLLSKPKLDALLLQTDTISRMMTGLRKSLKRRL